MISCILWLLMLSSLLTRSIRLFLTAVGRLGQPAWFRKVYLSFIIRSGSGLNWLRDWESPVVGMGPSLKVALLVWFSLWPCTSPGVGGLSLCPPSGPQLHAGNLICSSVPFSVLLVSRSSMSGQWVRMCLLGSVSSLAFKVVRQSMMLWDVPEDGQPWKVELDIRGLGSHLDFTRRARAGTLFRRVKDATHGVVAVCALPLGFQVQLGLVRGKYLPAGLHAVEASYVSASSLSSFRAAIVRSVWSSKMPLAGTPVTLNLQDGPVGVDPALNIVWSRIRNMLRYLAYRPHEVPRIFRMLDLVERGAEGHGPVHFSAAELGFAWNGREQGWVRVALLSASNASEGLREVSGFQRLFTTTFLFPSEGKR